MQYGLVLVVPESLMCFRCPPGSAGRRRRLELWCWWFRSDGSLFRAGVPGRDDHKL